MSITPTVVTLGRGLLRGGANERPLNDAPKQEWLTFYQIIVNMHRRAGRDARPLKGGPYAHGDCHKYCAGYSCGNRKRDSSPRGQPASGRTAKIVAWRKAKALANRAYLEEHVYAKTQFMG